MPDIIQHSKPTLGPEEIKAAASVIESGHIAQGQKVQEFEEALADFVGVKGAVVANSGTSALHLGLIAFNLGPGDDVILPSYVCSETIRCTVQRHEASSLGNVVE